MNSINEKLWLLQSLQARTEGPSVAKNPSLNELRSTIPVNVLARFDHMQSRGKRPVVAVRHGVCTGCHLQITKADLMALLYGEEVKQCSNCGRYLFLPADEANDTLQAEPVAKAVEPKPRKRRSRECQMVA
jgi:hypothetical protein